MTVTNKAPFKTRIVKKISYDLDVDADSEVQALEIAHNLCNVQIDKMLKPCDLEFQVSIMKSDFDEFGLLIEE